MRVNTLSKQPYDSRLFNFSFDAKLAAGQTITTIATLAFATPPAGLTAPTISEQALWESGRGIQFRLAGGTAGSYKLTARVTTEDPVDQLEAEGQLNNFDA